MRGYHRVLRTVGQMVRLFSWTLLAPAVLALYFDAYDTRLFSWHVPRAVPVFLTSFVMCWVFGRALGMMAGPDAQQPLREREAYLTVGVGWLAMCAVAMVPFMLEGVLLNPLDAFFEAMSGMTTTGATVIRGIDDVPRSLMIWRSLLQFIGGMGIVVLSVALLSRLSRGGGQLMQAEAPGPKMERITPRIATTAALLWKIYASLAGVLFLVLMAVLWRHHYGFKDTLYEAIVLTLSTISTGGFGAHAEGINFYHDALLEGILIVFMLLSGMNFTLHYWLLQGRPKVLWRDEEWRFYMGTFAIATLAVTGMLARTGETVGGALRDSAFTVASLITSTGFATADFDGWPAASKLILLLVMVTGATAGSTGGGIKHIRVLMMFKLIHRQYRRAMHPRGVLPITVGYRQIPTQSILGVGAFIGTYIAIATAGALLLTAFDPTFASFPDAASASITALSNMGPGLGAVGPTHDFADVALISKTILSLEMWIGRLEIFAAILVFSPEAWKH